MILKNSEGEVRLIWHLFILVVPFLIAAYMLRYVPVRVLTDIYINQGIAKTAALSRARSLFLDEPVWSSVLGIIQGLLWYILVCFLIRVINKEICDLKSFGLAIRGKNFLFIPLGFILGLLIYFGYFWVGSLVNQGQFEWAPAELSATAIILMALNFVINGYGEETAFRAYWQSKLIHRHPLWLGIIIANASFVLLHLLIYRFSGPILLASFLVSCLYGVLYLWTESVFLVGTMHAVFNMIPQLLHQWPSDIGMITVNSIALALAAVLYHRYGKVSHGKIVS